LQRNLTLEELSDRSGCTAGFLYYIEQNRAVPSVVMLDAIAQAPGTRIADFFPETIHITKIVHHDQRESSHFEGSSMVYSLLSSKFLHAVIEAFF
jgi:transcriptional regulator with XRE-family HTH domain